MRILVILYVTTLVSLWGTSQNDYFDYYIERSLKNNAKCKLDYTDNRSIIIEQLLHSGKVLHSGKIKSALEVITQKNRLLNGRKVLPFVSNQCGAFADSNGTIYITTGTIAQAEYPEELYFFIARAIVDDRSNTALSNRHISYEEKLSEVLFESPKESFKLDSLAILGAASNLSKHDIDRSLDVLRFQHLPYKDMYGSLEFFSSPKMYVPQYIFKDVILGRGEIETKSIKFKELEKLIEERKNKFKELSTPESAKGNYENFTDLQKACRRIFIEQLILNGDSEQALYCIYVEELEGDKSAKLEVLKAHAWMSLAMGKLGLYDDHKNYSIRSMQGKSDGFFSFLRMLGIEGTCAMSLRMLSDLEEQSAENKMLFSQMKEKLLSELIKSPKFSFDKFDKENRQDDLIEHCLNYERAAGSESKYETMNNPNEFDHQRFFLYGLFDINQEYTSPIENKQFTFNDITVLNNTLFIKGFSVNSEKSLERKMALDSYILDEIEGVKIEDPASLDNNFQRLIKETFNELYMKSDYQSEVFLLNANEWKNFPSDRKYVMINLFQHQVSFAPKGYHYFGAFGVTLPFLIPDYLLKLNKSIYASILIEKETGKVMNTEFLNFDEPITKRILANKINETIIAK